MKKPSEYFVELIMADYLFLDQYKYCIEFEDT